jgi:hypothetical protein
MPWTIPDKGEGLNNLQSILFQEYLDVLVAGIQGVDCVIEGGAITGGADMTPAVADTLVLANGSLYFVAGADVTITTADTTNPRLDLIVVTAAGAFAVRTGTAAANPKPPARTANDVVLGVVYVPAGATAIASTNITDLRLVRSDLQPQAIIRADSDRTLTSQTAAQAIFNSPTNGRLTLPTGCYQIEGVIYLDTMNTTSGNAQLGLLGSGSAVLGAQLVHVVGVDGASGAAATQTGSTTRAGNTSPASAVTAGTGTAMTMRIRGTFEVTTAGTIVPSIALVTANAAIVRTGSYLRFKRLGSTSLVSSGRWD